MTSFTILLAGKMPPKLTAAERAQFRAEAKNAAASEIRSKKRHSMNAATTTPAVIIPPPPPQTENPNPAKVKGKETVVVVTDPPATRSKRPRGAVLPGITIQEPSTNSALRRPRSSRHRLTKIGV